MPIFIFILYKIFIYITELLNKITLDPLLNVIENMLERRSILFKRMVGVVFQLPRSICYIIFITFLLNTLSVFNVTPSINKYLGQSKPYDYICKKVVIPITNSSVARQLPNILSDSFKVVEKDAQYPNINTPSNIGNRTIIYYNGVTLEEGIKSNSEIDKLAVKLTSGETDDKVKANLLYSWVGKNISYDNDKASSVLNNNFSIKSGAIEAYNTRKGICFDYACLYVAMCRANGIKVRLITGEGFNGVSWVSHAWNQVYLKATNNWINVDTTFYNGGNYFNSKVFQRDHKNSKVAGEW
jgi:transglutaminase-like putative cysteine protease